MGAIASQITRLTIVYSTVYSDADQRKHQSSASLAFVRGIHRGPVNSPHKWSVTRKMFPFDDVIMFREVTNLVEVLFSKTSRHRSPRTVSRQRRSPLQHQEAPGRGDQSHLLVLLVPDSMMIYRSLTTTPLRFQPTEGLPALPGVGVTKPISSVPLFS